MLNLLQNDDYCSIQTTHLALNMLQQELGVKIVVIKSGYAPCHYPQDGHEIESTDVVIVVDPSDPTHFDATLLRTSKLTVEDC